MIIKYFEEKNVARYCFELEIVCDEFVLYLSYLIVNILERKANKLQTSNFKLILWLFIDVSNNRTNWPRKIFQ